MRFAAKLAMSYLVVVALAAAMSLGLTLANAATVRGAVGQEAALLAEGLAGRMERTVGLRIEELESHSRHALFQEALARSDGSEPGAVVARASTGPVGFPADSDWWSVIQGGGVWTGETPAAVEPSTWGIGVEDGAGQLAGAFRGVLSGMEILRDALGDAVAASGRKVRVIDGDNRLAYSTGNFTFGEDLGATQVVRGLSSDSGSFSGYEGGQALYYSYARSLGAGSPPALGWTVLVVGGLGDALAPIWNLWRCFGLFLFLLAATTTVVGIILARTLSRPILVLTASMLAVSPGEPGVRIPPPLLAAGDETGSLARAIREMARSLEQSVAESRRKHRLVVSLNQVAHAVLLAGSPEEVFAAAGRGILDLGFCTAIWRVEEGGHSLCLAYASFPAELLRLLEEAAGVSSTGYSCRVSPGGVCASIISAIEPAVLPMEPVWDEILADLGPERIERAKAVLGPRQIVGMPLRADGTATYLLMVICPQVLESDAAAIGAFHLLITDVVLPKSSGVALSRSIASLRPQMPVLFMSGYTDRAALDGEGLGAHGHYLQKPFGMESLAHKVRAMLDAAGGAP